MDEAMWLIPTTTYAQGSPNIWLLNKHTKIAFYDKKEEEKRLLLTGELGGSHRSQHCCSSKQEDSHWSLLGKSLDPDFWPSRGWLCKFHSPGFSLQVQSAPSDSSKIEDADKAPYSWCYLSKHTFMPRVVVTKDPVGHTIMVWYWAEHGREKNPDYYCYLNFFQLKFCFKAGWTNLHEKISSRFLLLFLQEKQELSWKNSHCKSQERKPTRCSREEERYSLQNNQPLWQTKDWKPEAWSK